MLVARSPAEFREGYNIDARVNHRVDEIDLRRRTVRVRHMREGTSSEEPFDELLIATGTMPLIPKIPGIEARGIHALSTLQSGLELRRVADEKRPQKIVIVGGGYIGLEAAENFLRRGSEVALVEKTPQVMNTLDGDMAALVSDELQKAGVRIYLEESVQGFEVKGGEVRAVATERRTLPADLVVLGLGARADVRLAKEAGIPLGTTGAIKVNEKMGTGLPGVWAAGNCVESFHLVSRRPVVIALATVANKQGRIAGINIAGGDAAFPGVVGTAMVKAFDWEVARTGLQEREAEEAGMAFISAKIESRTRAAYFPDSGKIHVKVLAEKGNGRLIGGQIVGRNGAGKRIDTLATSLHAGFTLEEMIHLDLGYTPPFSPGRDPVSIACRQALKTLE